MTAEDILYTAYVESYKANYDDTKRMYSKDDFLLSIKDNVYNKTLLSEIKNLQAQIPVKGLNDAVAIQIFHKEFYQKSSNEAYNIVKYEDLNKDIYKEEKTAIIKAMREYTELVYTIIQNKGKFDEGNFIKLDFDTILKDVNK